MEKELGVRKQVRSGGGIKNGVGSGLQEAGKSRVHCGNSRKSAPLLRQLTQLTSRLSSCEPIRQLQVLRASRYSEMLLGALE